MKSHAGRFRAEQRVCPRIPWSVIGLVVLLVPLEERLMAQVCPELPVLGDAVQLEWDAGFQWQRIASFCTSADDLTMYFDQVNGQGIWKTQRDQIDVPWSTEAVFVPFPVSSGAMEWVPTLSPDGRWLYFNSNREGNYDIYAATRTDPGNPNAHFDRAIKLSADINDGFSWIGSVSHNGTEIYYVRGGNWELWVASFNEPGDPEKGFVDARPLTVLNTPAQAARPCISPDGTTLFFSDRPQEWNGGAPPRLGGMGSTDLWVARRCESFGPWEAPPVNIGSINTAGHEYSPWLSSDGSKILYVVADGRVLHEAALESPPLVPRFLRGDCNADGGVNISDATCILNWLFAGEADPGCVAATNTNGDAAANITDATYLLNHLFAGGAAPVAPFPDCGPGMLPADAALGCANPPNCQ